MENSKPTSSIGQVLRTGMLVLIACAVAVAFFVIFYVNGPAGAEDRAVDAAIAVGVIAVFGIAVLLPMLPGYLEVRRSKDAEPLTIDQSYSRDPRYMGKSFRAKISEVLANAPMHTRMPFLHRQKEFARVVPSLEVDDDDKWTDSILSKGPFATGSRVTLVDVYAHGDVRIGAGSKLRALAGDGNVQLGENVSLLRWIDAEKDLVVGAGADLGHSASALGRIVLAQNVRFLRVCGNPVLVGASNVATDEQRLTAGKWFSGGKRRMTARTVRIAKGEVADNDVISKGGVELLEGATVNGSVKAGGDAVVGPGATIAGNLVARGNVVIQPGASIRGHVFAEGNVYVARGGVIGAPGAAKTLYSSRNLQLADGASVYGWAICERAGTTVTNITTA